MARPNPHQRLIKGGGGRDQTRRISKCVCVSALRKPAQSQKKTSLAETKNSRKMAGGSSLEAVKKKIKSLQEQADAAEDRAALLQRELNQEKSAKEAVSRR